MTTRTSRPGGAAAAGARDPAVPAETRRALDWATSRLGRDPASARREALYLLAGVVGTSPGQVWLRIDRPLSPRQREEYRRRVERRLSGEPLQYIEGRAAFRELILHVDRSVLIPRPETEQLVEHVLDWGRSHRLRSVVDLGTGSAAIAISLAIEGDVPRIVGVDISRAALNVARKNVAEAGVADRVELRSGSFFEPLKDGERFDVIVSNPPYVGRDEAADLAAEVRDWEPHEALFAGPTGLEAIERIVSDAPRHSRAGGLLALELAPGQADAALGMIRSDPGYRSAHAYRDLAGRLRVVLAEID